MSSMDGCNSSFVDCLVQSKLISEAQLHLMRDLIFFRASVSFGLRNKLFTRQLSIEIKRLRSILITKKCAHNCFAISK